MSGVLDLLQTLMIVLLIIYVSLFTHVGWTELADTAVESGHFSMAFADSIFIILNQLFSNSNF